MHWFIKPGLAQIYEPCQAAKLSGVTAIMMLLMDTISISCLGLTSPVHRVMARSTVMRIVVTLKMALR